MSRSRKKTPYCGDKKNHEMKRLANHRVRQALKNHDLILQGNDYKKLFCSYDICDWYTIEHSFNEFCRREIHKWHEWGYRYEPFPTKEELWRNYNAWYIRK